MKIIISSLQVTSGSSKGHLHPAIEIALALKERGHHVVLMPLPSPLGDDDQLQVQTLGLESIELTNNAIELFSGEKLASLATETATEAEAYESFLVAPLQTLYARAFEFLTQFKPDIVVYDLMVYPFALAARKLSIPDIGFCAGLKLIAPPALTLGYETIGKRIATPLKIFLQAQCINAEWHRVELLSSTFQMVFAPPELGEIYQNHFPKMTRLVGALHCHANRHAYRYHASSVDYNNCVIVVFGSTHDPADYSRIVLFLEAITKRLNLHLIIISRKWHSAAAHVFVYDYLPLQNLLLKAQLIIHHGGANTFSEAIAAGIPQLIMPLCADQNIQAELVTLFALGNWFDYRTISLHQLQDLILHTLQLRGTKELQQAQMWYARGDGNQQAASLIESVGIKPRLSLPA